LIAPQWLFGIEAALAAVCGAMAVVVWWRRRRWPLMAASALLSVFGLAALWRVWGECLLPHLAVAAYRPGMTLCPGQSVSVPIELRGRHDQAI
jgi:hypothetical protein